MVKVLFDHNMPPVIARALHALVSGDGHEAWALRDRYPTNVSDIEYFTDLGREPDWVVISKDRKNAKRRPEREAILRSGVLAFYLAPSVERQKVNEQAASIIWQWDKIVTQRAANRNGLYQLPIGRRTGFKQL